MSGYAIEDRPSFCITWLASVILRVVAPLTIPFGSFIPRAMLLGRVKTIAVGGIVVVRSPNSQLAAARPTLSRDEEHQVRRQQHPRQWKSISRRPVAIQAESLVAECAHQRHADLHVGDNNHHARIFCALVGASSRARKGTSLDPVERILDGAQANLDCLTTRSFPSGLKLKWAAIEWRGVDQRNSRQDGVAGRQGGSWRH